MAACYLGFIIAIISVSLAVTTQEFDREICQQPPQLNRCRAAIPMYYFNTTTNSCQEFIWGGCPGSKNKFPNRETCIRNCHPEACALKPETGPCRSNIKLWFYDMTHRKCHQFSYGGCEGNENKFGSQHNCETACAGTNLACELGEDFNTVGDKSVHEDYRDKLWFTYSCEKRCRESCVGAHSWGTCLAFSTRKRWYRCECYLYDRPLSPLEFDDNTSGATRNRKCADGSHFV